MLMRNIYHNLYYDNIPKVTDAARLKSQNNLVNQAGAFPGI